MRYYTRCQTEIQKEARKILRQAVRSLRSCELVDPSKLSFDWMRDVNASHIRTWKRIIAAYHDAKTDNELIAATALTQSLADSMVEMQEMRGRMHEEDAGDETGCDVSTSKH
jgi:hypothetical protein